MSQNLTNVYDFEYKQIQALGWNIQQRWNQMARHIELGNVKETSSKLNEFTKWVEGEFEKIGFIAGVDVTPIYRDQPPVISLMDRINPADFDHERKASEVKRSK